MGGKILITGASGFIGGFLVEKALGMGLETYAGVRKSSNRDYLRDERIHFIDLFFSDKKKLKAQLEEFTAQHGKFDYIIHNAGITKSIRPDDFYKVNFSQTVNFIDALIDANAVPKKFILMSSLSVMGPGDERDYAPILLSHPAKPNTVYGKSKLLAEEFLKSKPNFPFVVLRPTGVYGPREKDYFMMVKTILSGFDVSAGFQEQRLTFIYVRDLVDAAFLALASPLERKTYFVSDGKVYTDAKYTSLVREILGKKMVIRLKIPLFIIKAVSFVAELISRITQKPSTLNRDKFKIMKQRNWICETEPLKNDLGFSAKYDLEAGLKESIQWYKEQGWI